MLKKIWPVILFLSVMFVNVARAENFEIENYDISLRVDKNRTVRVQEVINVYFTSPAHGIIRDIPTSNSEVSHISVSAPYSVSTSIGSKSVKIGSEDVMVSGRQSYRIEYTHQLYSNADEFYYNLIGTDWGVPIHHVRFHVQMPDLINPDKVGISIGRYGTRGFDGVAEYIVKEDRVFGQTKQTLPPYNGITVRMELPEGYFTKINNQWPPRVLLGFLICTLLSFFTWYVYGHDDHVTAVVTFEAPKEINSAESELVNTEKVSAKGLISLIVWLANKGYLKIMTVGKNFTLTKLKDYDGDNAIELDLMTLLFEDGDTVRSSDLKESSSFYEGWNQLLDKANKNKMRQKFYEKSSLQLSRRFMMFLCVAGNFALTLFAMFNYRFSADDFAVATMLLGTGCFFIAIFYKSDWFSKIVGSVILLCTVGQALFMFIKNIQPENMSQVVLGAFCVVISMICLWQMPKPNTLGKQYRGQLFGLKNFIRFAEKPRLEKMVEQNPEYFYNILPYAYIMGVSDKWIKNFEGIAVPPPVWAADNHFRINNFNNFARGFNAVTVPSVENGGISRSSSSSGGGGFSGGGFGGGGGHSW